MRGLCCTLVLALLLCPAHAQDAPSVITSKVTLHSAKKSIRALQMYPASKGPFPAIVLLHGDFGLNAWIKKQAERLAGKGYLVFAVDLYDGELPKTIDEAHILERGLDDRRVLANLKDAVDYLEKQASVRKGSIGIVGWDCGSGYALDAAMADPRLKAVVMCHGRVTTDVGKLASLRAEVLALFGGKDEGIPPATIERFRRSLAKAGKSATIHVYPESGNSFMDPDSPYFEGTPNLAVIADAWAKIDAHLEKLLKK